MTKLLLYPVSKVVILESPTARNICHFNDLVILHNGIHTKQHHAIQGGLSKSKDTRYTRLMINLINSMAESDDSTFNTTINNKDTIVYSIKKPTVITL